MTATPAFSALIQRLHSLHCPFALDLTELDLNTAASPHRLHLLHFLLTTIAPTLAPPSSSTDALAASCVAVGVCDRAEAVSAVSGVDGGSWTLNGRVLFALLDLAEARHSSSPSLDSAYESHLSLLSAASSAAASLLSTELHLFPADVLLTNKQLNQQPTGQALVTQLAQQTDTLQSQLDSLPAASTSSPSPSSSALPSLLSSMAELSVALPAFHTFHTTHIAPHWSSFTTRPTAPSAALLGSSVTGLSSVRSAVCSRLQCVEGVWRSMDVSGVCGLCDSANGYVGARAGGGAGCGTSLDLGKLSLMLRC